MKGASGGGSGRSQPLERPRECHRTVQPAIMQLQPSNHDLTQHWEASGHVVRLRAGLWTSISAMPQRAPGCGARVLISVKRPVSGVI